MAPVNNLAGLNVNALIVGGIGMRPLLGFNQVGIDVYYDPDHLQIGPVIEDLVAGNLPIITNDQTCDGGGSECHGHK